MFKIVKSLLGRGSSSTPSKPQPPPTAPSSGGSPDIEFYFRNEVYCSEYIRDDKRQTVLNHLLGKANILKTENKLSLDEKRGLGVNTRLTITRELVDVLNENGMGLAYPAAAITGMWNNATVKKTRHDNLEKMRANAVSKFKLRSCGDGNDCDWCKANQDIELPADFDLEREISVNCKCNPYCKCFTVPIIDFDSLA